MHKKIFNKIWLRKPSWSLYFKFRQILAIPTQPERKWNNDKVKKVIEDINALCKNKELIKDFIKDINIIIEKKWHHQLMSNLISSAYSNDIFAYDISFWKIKLAEKSIHFNEDFWKNIKYFKTIINNKNKLRIFWAQIIVKNSQIIFNDFITKNPNVNFKGNEIEFNIKETIIKNINYLSKKLSNIEIPINKIKFNKVNKFTIDNREDKKLIIEYKENKTMLFESLLVSLISYYVNNLINKNSKL